MTRSLECSFYVRYMQIFFFIFRLFELESNGHRNELKVHYIHSERTHVQAFPVQIADDQWHRLAVTFTHHFVNVYVDCEQVFERQVDSADLSFIEEDGVRLWVAQRGEQHAQLQVCKHVVSSLVYFCKHKIP